MNLVKTKSIRPLFKNCKTQKEIFIYLLSFYREAVQRLPQKKLKDK
jgi:hypothetical protein